MRNTILVTAAALTALTCSHNSPTFPEIPQESDLRRAGNFIAIASDRGGDPAGDIFLVSVDSLAHRDTLIFRDTLPNGTVVFDTVPPVIQLTNRTGVDENPAWSPDGDKLAFVSDRGGYRAIWVFHLNLRGRLDTTFTPNPRQLTDPGQELGDANPTWSPDGKWVAFERRVGSTAGLRDVYIVPSDDYGETEEARNLTKATDVDCFNPEWAPRISVNKILFESRNSGTSSDWDVFCMSADDTTGFDDSRAEKITNPNRNGHPSWSPNCGQIVYERNPPGSDSAYDVQIQSYGTGTDDKVLLTSGGYNRYPSWLPNGHLIAFIKSQDIFIIDISAGTAAPVVRQLFAGQANYRNWDISW